MYLRNIRPGWGASPGGALASRADMGAPLADENAPDLCPAAWAGRSGLAVGVKLLLVPAAFAARQDEMRVAVSKGGAQIPDSFTQGGPNSG